MNENLLIQINEIDERIHYMPFDQENSGFHL